ncbi:lysophosphatidic acid receptor 4-like [Chanodichthys erythropterus]|uniref:lysophosphatidic acid receptor 4-like n=1 Tax=Chanodichthys erythropterus TaxID=933992 RepID=UPI00351EBD12
MNNSTVNFTTTEASTNSTIQSISLLDSLGICFYIINFLFGLPTHSYVIWLIITGTGSGVASEFLSINLSVCEIANCLNCFICLLSLVPRFTQLSLLSHVSSFFSSLIKLSYFLQSLGLTGRPLFQCLICVERYLAVVHPVTFLKYKPLRYRVICCTVAWIIILGTSANRQGTTESNVDRPSSEGQWRPLHPEAHEVAGLAERPPEGTEEGRIPYSVSWTCVPVPQPGGRNRRACFHLGEALNLAGKGRERAAPVSNPSAKFICEPHDLNRLSASADAGSDHEEREPRRPPQRAPGGSGEVLYYNARKQPPRGPPGHAPLPDKQHRARVYPHP